MLLTYTETRAVRMLVALLAAADPLGRLDAGHRPAAYEPVAVEIFEVLRAGGRDAQVIATLAAQCEQGVLDTTQRRAANAFLAAALDWWVSTERLLDVSAFAS